MKSELRIKPHSVIPAAQVVEVWHGDEFIATITGADGPGVRIISKYQTDQPHAKDGPHPHVTEILFKLNRF